MINFGSVHRLSFIVSLLLLSPTACVISADFGGTDFLCTDGECPDGQICNAERRCVAPADGPDAAGPTASFRSMLDISGPAEPLTDFPLLVRLDETRIDFAQTMTGGVDVFFTLPDGTLLAHEIESWTPPTAEVWVNVPSLSAGTTIVMGFGGDVVNNAATVWNDYQAVFHLGDARDSSNQYADAVDNGTTETGGVIGNARGFASGFLSLGADQDFLRASSEVTVSAWVRRSPAMCLDDCTVFGASVGVGNQLRSRVTLDLNSAGQPNVGVREDDARTNTIAARSATAIPADEWVWLAATADLAADRLVIYINGVQAGVTSGAGLAGTFDTSPSLQVSVGIDENLSEGGFLGDIDELRVRLDARSPTWIATQYDSLIDRLVSFGPIEEL